MPLRHGDRSLAAIATDASAPAAGAATLLPLLREIRRVLMPGGLAKLRLPAGSDPAVALALADRLGFDGNVGRAPGVAESAAGVLLVLRKPDRCRPGQPSVSIAIPAWSARFFEASLGSAIAQTYANLEIVVCDDSADGAIEAIARRLGAARRVTYIRNPHRLRGRANYAKCFAVSGGEFVKFLNDDDVLAPDCVERLVDGFAGTPDIVLATSYRRRIDADGVTLPDQPATRPLVEGDSVIEGASLANVMLMAGLNVVGEPTTTLFRRADLLRAMTHGFRFDSTDCMGVIDMAMWLPLLLQGDAVYVRAPLTDFRIHAAQQQHDPALREPTVRAIRSLQAQWLALGLYRHYRADMLLVRPLDHPDERWRAQPFAVSRPAPAIPRWWT